MPQNDTFFLLSDKAPKNGMMKHHHYSCGPSQSYSDDRVRTPRPDVQPIRNKV